MLSTSADNGVTRQEVLTVDPDAGGPVRSFDPELWIAPDARLFLFWAQMEKGRCGLLRCLPADQSKGMPPGTSAASGPAHKTTGGVGKV